MVGTIPVHANVRHHRATFVESLAACPDYGYTDHTVFE